MEKTALFAEALARQTLGSYAEIQSAGSHPGKLNPYAVAVMREIGVDISKQHSKSIDSLAPPFIPSLDYVITLCAEEVCPVMISRAKKLHWPLPDPATNQSLAESDMLARFRAARDTIQKRLRAFERELSP